MNQAQRKYLIEKIQKNTEVAIKKLENTLPKEPNLYNYCIHALSKGTLMLKSKDSIMKILDKRMLNSGNISESGGWAGSKSSVSFRLDEIFVVPEEYKSAVSAWSKEYDSIKDTIATLKSQSDGLCTRIQLASDKTLDKMITEVDDMGDISFMDCTLKSLMTKGEMNLLK